MIRMRGLNALRGWRVVVERAACTLHGIPGVLG